MEINKDYAVSIIEALAAKVDELRTELDSVSHDRDYFDEQSHRLQDTLDSRKEQYEKQIASKDVNIQNLKDFKDEAEAKLATLTESVSKLGLLIDERGNITNPQEVKIKIDPDYKAPINDVKEEQVKEFFLLLGKSNYCGYVEKDGCQYVIQIISNGEVVYHTRNSRLSTATKNCIIFMKEDKL